MAEPGAGRAWRAACPHCGAPVDFQSAAAPLAVCSYCRSTLVRDGETLRRIGQSAELFDDHSPLGLGTRGSAQGESFTLVGRLQYSYSDTSGPEAAEGRWTAWHALFDNGRSAILSEDNGSYVMSWPQQPPEGLPPDLATSVPGSQYVLLGQIWRVTSHVQARVHALQGEWPVRPQLAASFGVWELRNDRSEVLSIEASTVPAQVDVGRRVRLAELKLSGLPQPDVGRTGLKSQGLSCPSCGSALIPTLETTRSITCGSCRAVVDISKGVGADLAFFKQGNALPPLIALGAQGKLSLGQQVLPWQVVGYQERRSMPIAADEESWFWREYLLYNRSEGFAFLVDASDGWSLVQPLTGAPSKAGEKATWQGTTYVRKEAAYAAETTYVLGEFYWPVRKRQKSLNTDYGGTGVAASLVLNREVAAQEETWSAGRVLSTDEVIQAFGIKAERRGAFVRDQAGVTSSGAGSAVVLVVLVVTILLVMSAVSSCSDSCSQVRDAYGESSQEYQQCRARAQTSSGGWGGSGGYGGSYGGYSSGGSHK